MKRRITALAIALVVAATASGCGIGKKGAETTGETMKITWLPQCDTPINEDSPVIAKIEEETGVDLEFIYVDRSKMTELLNVRLASGEIPDVLRTQDSATFTSYVDQGVITDIPEDVLKSKGKTLYEITKQNGGENVWEYGKINGKIYGIPLLSVQAQYSTVPIWREDWLKNVGIDKIPETLEEAEAAFYAFANNDPDKNGQKDTYGLSDKGMAAVYGAFGIQPNIWQEIDGKIVYTSVTQNMKEALMLLNKWYKDGIIDPEFISGENKGQYWANTVSMWNGKIGFSVPGAYYHISPATDYLTASANYTNFKQIQGDDANYVTAKPFVGKDGRSGTTKSAAFSGAYLNIGRYVKDDSAKMEKIIEINNRLMEDLEFYALALKGIKDEHYEIRDGHYFNIVDTSKDPQAGAKLGLTSNGIGFILGNNFDFSKETTVDKYEYADSVALIPGYANAVTGALPSSAQYMATISARIQEANILFITGEKSFDEWDAYVDGLYKAGLEQLTKEANDWYNKYNK